MNGGRKKKDGRKNMKERENVLKIVSEAIYEEQI